jgi:sporulation protein YlmC with PRC-barrel domain
MLKHVALAALLTCGAAAAHGQPQQAASPPSSTVVPASPTAAPVASADTRKLIGRNVQTAQNESIGEIKSIYIGKDGKVDSVIVSVGGFLGVGNREVSIAWSDLTISGNGETVMVNMTKDELKAKPEYKYANESYRGRIFTDSGLWTSSSRTSDATKPLSDNLADTTRPAGRIAQTTKPADPTDKSTTNKSITNMAATTSTGDFNAAGNISANALIGATVRNENRETVGKVEDLYVDDTGAIKTIVVSVGGFLGVGAKDVAVKWSDVKFSRDGKSVVITTSWTRDSLMTMPDYKHERRQPAGAPRSGG